jgi:hypothetical protein
MLWPIEKAGMGSFLPWSVAKILRCGKMKKKNDEFAAAHFEYFSSARKLSY